MPPRSGRPTPRRSPARSGLSAAPPRRRRIFSDRMDARHCAGAEMAEMMAYAAAVGSAHAKKVAGAVGFVGCAAAATAHFFGRDTGMGTMPHALIGYAGSTVRAAEM